MRVVHSHGRSERELELRIGRPDATLADLAAALGVPVGGLSLDGRVVPPETGMHESGLADGSRLVTGKDHVELRPGQTAVVLRLVGGLEAGRSVSLPADRTVIGRGTGVDVRVAATGVSREHAALEVSPDGRVAVTDLISANGTDLNGRRITETVALAPEDLVSLGGETLLRVLPPDRLGLTQRVNPVREAGLSGTLPFNRPPRGGAPIVRPPLEVPAALAQSGKTPFSVSSMLGPLLMAGAIVALTHDVRYAAIAALSPLMFLANFAEDRLRGRFGLRRGRRAHAARLAAFGKAVEAAHLSEVRACRSAYPDAAEVVYRATAPALTLWERRPGAPDFLRAVAGWGDLPWAPPLRSEGSGTAPEAEAILARYGTLPQVPVVVGLAGGEVVGLEGERRACLAVARSLLCQAVVGSGPADVTVAVFADPERLADWDWTKWLPHGADLRSSSTRLVAAGPEQVDALARNLRSTAAAAASGGQRQDGPVLLVVVDGAALLEGRPCPLRDLLAGASLGCGGIVLTTRLPALCTTVVTASAEGTGRVRDVASDVAVDGVLLQGMPLAEARRTARALARYEDPELPMEGATLPDRITLLPLLDLQDTTGEAIGDRWKSRVPALRVQAVLGVSERDLFAVDLDDDGPHALIAGTTGSGKSELLRTLIAAMAVDADPEHLTFVLVDYKGGGALDECAEFPHTVGLVTDLDEQLGQRALRCLEAEVHHRERLLRPLGLSHIRDYQRLRDTGRHDLEPMPRLVVVIDEFATLVKALPDFVDALVSVAQRGRSLGVHLVMATQRPAGSVSDAIKNNVKMRIALRLESSTDSQDVIDDSASAAIGSRQWGRAYYRLSAREVLPVQTALSTGVTPRAAVTAPVTTVPFVLSGAAPEASGDAEGPTDLQRLVTAAREAFDQQGFAPPRRPWPDVLPAQILAADLAAVAERGLQTQTTSLPAYALADDPDRQCQYPVGWDPAAGNLLVYGASGSGTTTALTALALSQARHHPPDRLHLFALDFGAGGLAPLDALPHTGAHIGAAERERQVRLIRLLRRELDSRKAAGPVPAPDWLVLVDNLGALLSDFDKDVTSLNLVDELARVYADGPAVGIRFAVTADRSGAVPTAWSALTLQKLLMRLADPGEYSYFDVPRAAVPTYVPGRALVAASHQVVQIALPGDDLADTVTQVAELWPDATRSAPGIGLLPPEVPCADLDATASTTSDPWWIPVGLDADSLSSAGLRLHERDHALIAGPQRSGRSTALCTLARQAANAPTAAVLAFAPLRSPLRDLPCLTALVTDYEEVDAMLTAHPGPSLLLVDDADTIDDEQGVLQRWLATVSCGHLVAAGRADGFRRLYGHWTQPARDSRCGVLLAPDHDLDGDLLGTTLPRHDRQTPLPGRGYLVTDGIAGGIQVAR
ncbi:hypothetical protein AA958_00195 [Streptomyces sp. CNQ-509]|nr:hypothetical protein AA958_00195 [Streptomyces sp. CNQ-509]